MKLVGFIYQILSRLLPRHESNHLIQEKRSLSKRHSRKARRKIRRVFFLPVFCNRFEKQAYMENSLSELQVKEIRAQLQNYKSGTFRSCSRHIKCLSTCMWCQWNQKGNLVDSEELLPKFLCCLLQISHAIFLSSQRSVKDCLEQRQGCKHPFSRLPAIR